MRELHKEEPTETEKVHLSGCNLLLRTGGRGANNSEVCSTVSRTERN